MAAIFILLEPLKCLLSGRGDGGKKQQTNEPEASFAIELADAFSPQGPLAYYVSLLKLDLGHQAEFSASRP